MKDDVSINGDIEIKGDIKFEPSSGDDHLLVYGGGGTTGVTLKWHKGITGMYEYMGNGINQKKMYFVHGFCVGAGLD